MAARCTCANGHVWQADEPAAAACPVCGAAGAPIDEATAAFAPIPPGESPTLPPAFAPEAPPAFPPPYEILGELGRGGMGVVYKARDPRLDRVVALKMVLAGQLAGDDERRRFLREAQAIAHLQHPNIVAIHEVGEAPGGVSYFTLEYCAAGTLADKVGAPWEPAEAAALVETLARAVQYAHEQGVVHRDLKPGNVLLTNSVRARSVSDGSGEGPVAHAPGSDLLVKVADFGLARRLGDARQTASGAIMGTPSYMAPEQAGGRGDELGPAADVYALGAILYELLTGRPPFLGPTAADTILRVLSDEALPPRRSNPKVPRDLDIITLKCLQKRPTDRYARAADLAADLRGFLAGDPIRARRRWAWPRALRRNRWLVVSLVLGGLIAVGVAFRGVQFVQWRQGEAIKRAFDEAYRLKDGSDKRAAVEAFDAALRLKPDFAEGYVHRGWLHRELGDHGRAVADYSEAIRLAPAGVWGYRGRAYMRLTRGEYADALEDLNVAVPLQPGDLQLRQYRASALLGLHRYEDALADVKAALEINPRAALCYEQASVAHAAERRWRLAAVDLKTAGGFDPGRVPPASVAFAEACAALGLGDEGAYRKTRDRLLVLADDESALPCSLAARACALPETTDVDPARLDRFIKTSVKKAPLDAYYRHVQGLVALRAGRLDEAAKCFQHALSVPSWRGKALDHLGLALVDVRRGSKSEAKRALEEARKAGVPVGHPHDALEYQLLLPQVEKAVRDLN